MFVCDKIFDELTDKKCKVKEFDAKNNIFFNTNVLK